MGSLPYLVHPITWQIISQCVIRLTNVGFQQSRVAMKQFKQHQSPPPFLTPCSFMYTEPVHFSSTPALYLREEASLWGETKMGKISSINLIFLLNLFQLSQSRSKIPASMSSILLCQEHSPWVVPVFWPAKRWHHIPTEIPAGTACALPQE